jgi:Helix-turn-helix domain
MSTTEKLIKARMGMLALAEQLNNVSAACRRAGISRSHYYEIKEAFEKFGSEGLAPQTRRKPRMLNQTPPELEAQILEMTERYPTYSYLRISDQLKLVGIGLAIHGPRGVATARPNATHSSPSMAGTENGSSGRHPHREDPSANGSLINRHASF